MQDVEHGSDQSAHYDALAERYASGYDDAFSRAYRDRFIHSAMFAPGELRGARVLEAMCGSGQETRYLLEAGARVVGLDISERQIEGFRRRWPGCESHCVSIVESGLAPESFDAAIIVGGLHHVHPRVPEALAEVHRLLRTGGTLCFMEPHTGSLPDRVRRLWYRLDPLFADNEAAIDLEALEHLFADRFVFESKVYRGNLAFLLVLNSMVFRIPNRLKRWISPPLLGLETLLVPLQRRWNSCFVVARWRKR
jgi:SAM-dependent methyltransferase